MTPPAATLPPPTPPPLPELEQLVEAACGVALVPGVRHTLAEAFTRVARERDLTPETLLRRLRAGDPACTAALVEQTVVGETYFFRHPEQLAALARCAIAPAPAGRPLSFWSAGCATGEEPYTLAMLLLEAGRAAEGDRILATDVSARALEAARVGRYGEWSLRRLDAARRARHFEPAGPQVAVTAAVRRRVEFQPHNLVAAPPPGEGFDAVLCRNVLIYFTPERAVAVLREVAGAVAPGGWLLLGPVEAPLADRLEAGFERVESEGAILLRRWEGGTRRGATATSTLTSTPTPTSTSTATAIPTSTPLIPFPPDDPVPTFADARAAARRGDLAAAERLALEVAARERRPEAWLLLALTAEARGDDAAALEAVRRALALAPGLPQALAALVPLEARLGRPEAAARARRAALAALDDLDDGAELLGVEPISAGALRQALGAGAGITPAGGRNG